MLAREHLLRARLAEYDPPLPDVVVPYGDDVVAIQSTGR
jgi:hypothetical protein